MSGLLPFFTAGLGFLFISAVEAFSSILCPSRYLPLRLRYTSSLALSSLFLLYSLRSSLSHDLDHDPLGASLPLSSFAASSLFLLYSLSGLLSLPPLSPLLLPLPSSFLDLLALFSFSLEFTYFYLRHKDLDGIENRYFDLLLVPILVCMLSTALVISYPRSVPPRLARAAGLALHGTWFLQMAFSFFTSAIAHGCTLHQRSTPNYTIKCLTHEEYHRARAIATLQFNCHLALLVLLASLLYGFVARNKGSASQQNGYRPLNKELQMGTAFSRFTLDSDEEDHDIAHESHARESAQVALDVPDESNGTQDKVSKD